MRITLSAGHGQDTDIYLGSSVFQELKFWLVNLNSVIDQFFIFTDKNTGSFCLEQLTSCVSALKGAEIILIQGGEKNKSIKSVKFLWEALASKGASRHSLLINLGGGMITDLGGFVASTFNRGIPFIHIPTSLLGMIDASIGGKTGINLGNIKNQVGTFRLPKAIFIYPEFLCTLARYELLSGFAEIIKIALVADIKFWERLKLLHLPDLVNVKANMDIWEYLICSSVELKCRIVEQDFCDETVREILNFGHTIGHAIESLSLEKGVTPLSHGHAISLGMICESFLSVLKAGMKKIDQESIINMILTNYEYYPLSIMDSDFIMEFIDHDKKRRSTGARFSLLNAPGNAVYGIPCTPSEIIKSIDFYRTFV